MEQEAVKLLNVLRRIARAAGYAQWVKAEPEATRFCVGQYNRVLARLSELEPAIKPLFTPLGEDVSPEVVRLAAREVIAYFEPDAPEIGWSFEQQLHPGYRSRRRRSRCVPISVVCR
jgi:hypothetical protein